MGLRLTDAHSELITQYPWGFGGTTPNASENAPDSGSFDKRRLVFRDTGRFTGESRNHSYTAIVGSDRKPRGGRRPACARRRRGAAAGLQPASLRPSISASRRRLASG